MANTRELRRRIKSIKNTSQITKAMQMVAATKMKRAQIQAQSGDPYVQTLNESLKRLTSKVDPALNPLLQENEGKNIGVIVLSTDKGLVGALNTNLLRTLNQFLNTNNRELKINNQFVFYTIGRKGRQFVVRTARQLAGDFENTDAITFRQAKQLAKLVTQAFLSKELKEVYLVYPDFISTLRQEPRVVKLLPISVDALEVEMGLTNAGNAKPMSHEPRATRDLEFLFEPSTSSLLDFILNHSIETKIYKALLETKASEHSARMIAMKNATDNAKDLVEDLTLSYNQTRQQAITNELLEITTAQAALE